MEPEPTTVEGYQETCDVLEQERQRLLEEESMMNELDNNQ